MATKYRVTAYNLDTLVTQVSDFDVEADRDAWEVAQIAAETWGTNDAYGVPLNYTVTDSTWEDYSAGNGLSLMDVVPVSADFTIRNGVMYNVATGGGVIMATTPGDVMDYWVIGIQVSQNGTCVLDSTTPPAKIIQSNSQALLMYKSGAWEKLTGVAFDGGAVSIERFDTDTLIPNILNYVTGSTATTLNFPNPEACEKWATIELVNRCTIGTVVQVSSGGYGPAFYSENNGVDGGDGTHDSITYVNNGVLWEQKQRNVSQVGGGGGAPAMTTDNTQTASFTAVENTIYLILSITSNIDITLPTGAVGDRIVVCKQGMNEYSATILEDGYIVGNTEQSATYERKVSGWFRSSEVGGQLFVSGGSISTDQDVRPNHKYNVNTSGTNISCTPSTTYDRYLAGDMILILNDSGSSNNAIFDPSGLNHSTTPGHASLYVMNNSSWKLMSTTMSSGSGSMVAPELAGGESIVPGALYSYGSALYMGISTGTLSSPPGEFDMPDGGLLAYVGPSIGRSIAYTIGKYASDTLSPGITNILYLGADGYVSLPDTTSLKNGVQFPIISLSGYGKVVEVKDYSGTVLWTSKNLGHCPGVNVNVTPQHDSCTITLDDGGWVITKSVVSQGKMIFAQLTDGTVGNTTSTGPLDNTGFGTKVLPAGFWKVGKSIRISGMGVHSSVSNPDLTFGVEIGSYISLSTGAIATRNSVNEFFKFEVIATCRSMSGDNVDIMCQGVYEEASGDRFGMVYTTPFTIDSTIAHTINVDATWSAASTDNSITLTNLIVENLQ